MISVTIGEVVGFAPALSRVMEIKLPAKAAYRLARIAAKLQPELKLFNDARIALFKELGDPVEGQGDTYQVTGEERQKQLANRLVELGAEPVVVDLEPLTVDMLGDTQVTPADLYVLEKLIT